MVNLWIGAGSDPGEARSNSERCTGISLLSARLRRVMRDLETLLGAVRRLWASRPQAGTGPDGSAAGQRPRR
jgi:hypothetical protein